MSSPSSCANQPLRCPLADCELQEPGACPGSGLLRWRANGIKNLPGRDARDVGLIPGSGRLPWRRKWRPAPVFLAGVSMPCSPPTSCPISSCPPNPWISPRIHPLSGGLRFPKACSSPIGNPPAYSCHVISQPRLPQQMPHTEGLKQQVFAVSQSRLESETQVWAGLIRPEASVLGVIDGHLLPMCSCGHPVFLRTAALLDRGLP